MTRHVVAVVFARGGSKGVPRKNLRLLGGKTLIARAVETARACRQVERTFVSTDDAEIADEARSAGAEVPFLRPADLARDDSPEWLAWQHAISTLRGAHGVAVDIMVSVPPTAPLRSVGDVERCADALLQSGADAVLTVRPADRNPWFNMVTVGPGGRIRLAMSPDRPISRRQDAPEVYDVGTVAYAARADYVLRASHLLEGDVRAVVVPRERAVDIDTETDLLFAEALLAHQTAEAERPVSRPAVGTEDAP